MQVESCNLERHHLASAEAHEEYVRRHAGEVALDHHAAFQLARQATAEATHFLNDTERRYQELLHLRLGGAAVCPVIFAEAHAAAQNAHQHQRTAFSNHIQARGQMAGRQMAVLPRQRSSD